MTAADYGALADAMKGVCCWIGDERVDVGAALRTLAADNERLRDEKDAVVNNALRFITSGLCEAHSERARKQSPTEFVEEHIGKCLLCLERERDEARQAAGYYERFPRDMATVEQMLAEVTRLTDEAARLRVERARLRSIIAGIRDTLYADGHFAATVAAIDAEVGAAATAPPQEPLDQEAPRGGEPTSLYNAGDRRRLDAMRQGKER